MIKKLSVKRRMKKVKPSELKKDTPISLRMNSLVRDQLDKNQISLQQIFDDALDALVKIEVEETVTIDPKKIKKSWYKVFYLDSEAFSMKTLILAAILVIVSSCGKTSLDQPTAQSSSPLEQSRLALCRDYCAKTFNNCNSKGSFCADQDAQCYAKCNSCEEKLWKTSECVNFP